MKKRSLREVRYALSVNCQGPTVGFVVPVPVVVKILAGSVFVSSSSTTLGESFIMNSDAT